MERLFITCDCRQDSGLSELLDVITLSGLEKRVAANSYGTSINLISIILFSHDFEWKPRIRFRKKELILSLDIVINFEPICNGSEAKRKLIVGQRMMEDLAQVVAKYKFKDFDLPRFLLDLEAELKSIDLLPADIVEN